MNADQERVGQSFRRVQGWFAANQQLLADNASLANQVETLNGIVSRLTDHATAQETQRSQTLLISKDELEKRRELLSYRMGSIVKVARALSGTVPGIGVLTRPKGNVSTADLITAATAMAEKAEAYKDVMVENGLPSNFIERLVRATSALKDSVDGRGLARAARVAATEGVANEIDRGRRCVAILDAVVTDLIRGDPSKLAEWRQLKRVTVKGVAPRGTTTSSIPVALTSTAAVAEPTKGPKAA